MEGNILITGGSGFLGRGIMRYAKNHNWKARFTVYSRDENKQDKCRQMFPDARFVLGDICDTERLYTTMLGHDAVIHAAALKYIPEGEVNASECIRVNIGGAQSIIKAARNANISTVVGISTDKAVSPVNVYGMSKAIMERLFAEAAGISIFTKFVCCRYGNVIGSTGSVIPVFQRQRAKQGYVTVTDPNMTRFWISIDEAVELILASSEAPDGCVVIPQPSAMKIMDLALAIVEDERLIQIIGIRPGEKLHEDLLNEQEIFRTQKWGNYYILMPPGKRYDLEEVPPTLRSDSPVRWIKTKEMRDLIIDAGSV